MSWKVMPAFACGPGVGSAAGVAAGKLASMLGRTADTIWGLTEFTSVQAWPASPTTIHQTFWVVSYCANAVVAANGTLAITPVPVAVAAADAVVGADDETGDDSVVGAFVLPPPQPHTRSAESTSNPPRRIPLVAIITIVIGRCDQILNRLIGAGLVAACVRRCECRVRDDPGLPRRVARHGCTRRWHVGRFRYEPPPPGDGHSVGGNEASRRYSRT